LLDFLSADQHAAVAERMRQVRVGGAAPLAERILRRMDGKAVDVETTSQSFVHDGTPAILTIIRDVTEHKRLEAQVRQSQKMEAVGQLAGGVAHDFNNLLTVIMSYSGLLASSAENGSGLARDLGEIRSAAERAAALTHQLLAFSRRQVLQPQVIDLNDLTGRLEGMLRRLVREDIELVTSYHPLLHPVSADPGQLEQVIVNLVVNAGDAMPAGGRLVIETMAVQLDARSPMLPNGAQPGPFVLLTVSDSGHGMDELTRSKIFDPFFTTKDPGKGTGLGLSTVYGIVQQSGGSISVYSEPGLGTTFKIYLPHASTGAVPASPKTVKSPIAGGSETVLLVEDDARVRGTAQRVLESAGYVVLLAATGAEALALLETQRERVGLMLTDLVMPEMGGRNLASRVASRWPDMKIIFMSGYTEDAASRASILAPGAQFLDKPFTPETLTGKVREVLQGASVPVS
jgi:signal transduction histidine kinase/ActR/RegA family two-component response regulator